MTDSIGQAEYNSIHYTNIQNVYILVWNIWGKQPRASHEHKWKDNIKEDTRKAVHLLDSTSSTGTNNQLCEHNDKPFVSIIGEIFWQFE